MIRISLANLYLFFHHIARNHSFILYSNTVAGLTGFSVGVINKCDVYLPIPLLVATSPRSMNPYGTTWERVLAMTGQPNTTPTIERQVEEESEFPSLVEPTVH